MKNMINMTACMMFITLSQGIFCSQELTESLSSLDLSESAFHDIPSTNSSPKNSRKESSSHSVLSIQLPELQPAQKEEGEFQDLIEIDSCSINPTVKRNNDTSSPRNYFNESPEEFEGNLEDIINIDSNERGQRIQLQGTFLDGHRFLFNLNLTQQALENLASETSSPDSKQGSLSDDGEEIMDDITSSVDVEQQNNLDVYFSELSNAPEKKTAYFTVQNGVIATTAVVSLATGYIFLRNRK